MNYWRKEEKKGRLLKAQGRKKMLGAAAGILLAACLTVGCGAQGNVPSSTASKTESAAAQSAQDSSVTSKAQPAPASEPAAPDPSWTVSKSGNAVRYIGGTFTKVTVNSFTTALEAAKEAFPYLGLSEKTELERIGDPLKIFDTSIYCFAEKRNGGIVEGSTLKLIVDGEGKVLAVNSALGGELTETAKAITAKDAEKVVAAAFPNVTFEITGSEPEPILITEDGRDSGRNTIRSAYRVYTDNPGFQKLDGDPIDERNAEDAAIYPYLIHYVSADGNYLFNMPARDVVNGVIPDQQYRHDDIFEMEGIEPVQLSYKPAETWKGAEIPGGELTLDLVRDSEGDYLLLDTKRRIVMCDYSAFSKENEPEFKIQSFDSLENAEQEMLVLWGRFAMVYDFYQNVVGWKAPDGRGTDVMLLYYVTDKEGNPKDEAYYSGARSYGFDMFSFGRGFGDAYALDIMAHEYTHCLTRRSLNGSFYYNDQGAINEALSDIIGYMIDMQILKEDGGWEIGRYQKKTVRSFTEPTKYEQPETSWGRYFQPNVYLPDLEENDNGGVHINSSLVNTIAYRLCAEGGMTYEEALRFWLTVDMSLTGQTDFAQLADMLPYTLSALGMDKYAGTLADAIEKSGLRRAEHPESVQPGTALVDLSVDAETFKKYFVDAEKTPVTVFLYAFQVKEESVVPVPLDVDFEGHFRKPVTVEDGEELMFLLFLQDNRSKATLVLDAKEDMWREVSAEIFGKTKEGQDALASLFEKYQMRLKDGDSLSMNLTNGVNALEKMGG